MQSLPAAQVAKQATATIPIVVELVAEPVECGLVANLAKPGGNLTGGAYVGLELVGSGCG